jgi:hypothetical protein
MAETTHQRVGIDRCESPLQTSFALTLMELGKFEWRSANSHEWEVGRWPGLELTLLVQPEWGTFRPHFSICPLPRHTNDIPFILLLALGGRIENSYLDKGDATVTLLYLPLEQVRRDMAACAYRVFDFALKLQGPHLQARYARWSPGGLPNLPCIKTLMNLQSPFTAPASDFSHHSPWQLTERLPAPWAIPVPLEFDGESSRNPLSS